MPAIAIIYTNACSTNWQSRLCCVFCLCSMLDSVARCRSFSRCQRCSTPQGRRKQLRMVRLGSMSMVKPLIIRAREARGKILDLASYLAVRRPSHCTSASNWGLPLLCFPALQGTSSLIKSWESTIFCNILFYVVLQQRPQLIPCT